MANMNRASFIKSAQNHNISEYQLILGKCPNNVIGFLYGGYKFDRVSTFTKCEIEMLMDDIACNGVVKAYENHTYNRNSKASHKISDAHGRMDGERIVNYFLQLRTNASPFTNIQFKGHTWISVLNQLVERESDARTSELNYWCHSMRDFHTNAKKVCIELVKSKQVRVLNGHVIPEQTFRRFLNQWVDENKIKGLDDNKMDAMIDMYCNKHMATIG